MICLPLEYTKLNRDVHIGEQAECERFILSEQCEQRTVPKVNFLEIAEKDEQYEQVQKLFGGACL